MISHLDNMRHIAVSGQGFFSEWNIERNTRGTLQRSHWGIQVFIYPEDFEFQTLGFGRYQETFLSHDGLYANSSIAQDIWLQRPDVPPVTLCGFGLTVLRLPGQQGARRTGRAACRRGCAGRYRCHRPTSARWLRCRPDASAPLPPSLLRHPPAATGLP